MKILPSTDYRHKEYTQGMKNCFGFYSHNARKYQDAIASKLMAVGYTHLENPFGHIPIHDDWQGFRSMERAKAEALSKP